MAHVHIIGKVPADFTERANRLREQMRAQFAAWGGVDVLILENFTLPWHHLAMGTAILDIVREDCYPCVHRGHDFPHDRPQYHWDKV